MRGTFTAGIEERESVEEGGKSLSFGGSWMFRVS